MKTTLKSALAAFAAATCIALGSLASAEDAKVKVGDAAPEIHAAGYLNAETAPTLAALKGKVVVVEFWATWCPPCRKSIPHLIELSKKHATDGLVLVGLTNEPKDKVAPFAEKMSMSYPVGFGSKSGEAYGVSSIPHAFVVGADGKVTWVGNPLSGEFDGAIESALKAAKK